MILCLSKQSKGNNGSCFPLEWNVWTEMITAHFEHMKDKSQALFFFFFFIYGSLHAAADLVALL